ncbi:hypothetical protein [Dubosiella newyorkensis]|uniref:hypothetical protein n=1 Tax=Dubosiella newyorkensis TaxID=1862672 RepID=UPI00272C5C8E|nr:hypothetical protein [Dubosiella newyorkensis]
MGRRKKRVGDSVYITGSISGDYFVVQAATIMSIAETGSHAIKVQIEGTGDTTYCSEEQVFYALKPAKEQVTKNFEKLQNARIKEKAEQQAKEREKEIMEKLKISTTEEVPTISVCLEKQNALPTFEEVAKSFYAMAKIGSGEPDESKDIVIALAEAALFEKIKHGCVWGKTNDRGGKTRFDRENQRNLYSRRLRGKTCGPCYRYHAKRSPVRPYLARFSKHFGGRDHIRTMERSA